MDQNKQNSFLSEMLRLTGVLVSWFVGILFIVIGLVMISNELQILGFLLFAGGALMLPIVKKEIKNKINLEEKYVNFVSIFTIIISLLFFTPETKDGQKTELNNIRVQQSTVVPHEQQPNPQTIPQTKHEEAQQPIKTENKKDSENKGQSMLHSMVYGKNEDEKKPEKTKAFNELEVVNNDIACQSKSDISQFVGLTLDEDRKAYGDLAHRLLRNGSCILIKEGDIVRLRDTAMMDGMVKIRKQGSSGEYWTLYENVK